jgi:predicted nucleic acid-binding protein
VYVDSSAFLKLYLEESDSQYAEQLLATNADWITARHTVVEVRRNLSRELDGGDLATARQQFERDWRSAFIVELTPEVCDVAADIAEVTGARTLDALHLGAARTVGGGLLPLVTFDLRQAQSARALGWTVLGS